MSPNEFQLRAALRDGEGDSIDPDTVIVRARAMTQARRDRRVRYLSVAAVVAVVGGIGTAAGITLSGSGNGTENSSGAGGAMPAQRSAAARPNAPGGANTAPGPLAVTSAVRCPATAPTLRTPAGSPNDQFGAAGPLFSGPVEGIKVCAYEEQSRNPIEDSSGRTANTVLTGPAATALATSLESAAKGPPKVMCPMYVTANGKILVIIGVSTSRRPMNPITALAAQNACGRPVTNGTAVRYNWGPPRVLSDFIAQLRTGEGGTVPVQPTGKATGSPIRS
jgi:hypothetical protein